MKNHLRSFVHKTQVFLLTGAMVVGSLAPSLQVQAAEISPSEEYEIVEEMSSEETTTEEIESTSEVIEESSEDSSLDVLDEIVEENEEAPEIVGEGIKEEAEEDIDLVGANNFDIKLITNVPYGNTTTYALYNSAETSRSLGTPNGGVYTQGNNTYKFLGWSDRCVQNSDDYLYTGNDTVQNVVNDFSQYQGILVLYGVWAQTKGKIGGLIWTFNDSNATLSFSGSGELSLSNESQPWRSLKSGIHRIDMSSTGITAIGPSCFSDLNNLQIVKFSSATRTIGDAAFSGCSRLGSTEPVRLPESITRIGNNAFKNCTNLALRSSFPSSLVSIGDKAFYGCTNLCSSNDNVITLGNYNKIGVNAFYGCKINEIICTSDDSQANVNPGAFDGIVITTSSITIDTKNATILNYKWPSNKTVDYRGDIGQINFILPCSYLTYADTSYTSYKYVRGFAFELPSISIKSTNGCRVTFKGWEYEKDGEIVSLSAGDEVHFEEPSVNLTADVEISGPCGTNLAWKYNTKSKVLSITGEGYEITTCNSGGYPWSEFADEVENITLPDSLRSIPSSAFTDCVKLESVSSSNGVPLPNSIEEIGNNAFAGCPELVLTSLPNSLTSIGDYAFKNDKKLAITSLPSGLTSIGTEAFDFCENITFETLPSGLTSIGAGAFSDCSNIATIKYDGTTLTTVGAGAFNTNKSSNIVTLVDTANPALRSYDWAGSKRTPKAVVELMNYGGTKYAGDSTERLRCIADEDGHITIPDALRNYEWYKEVNGGPGSRISYINDAVFTGIDAIYGISHPSYKVTLKNYDGTKYIDSQSENEVAVWTDSNNKITLPDRYAAYIWFRNANATDVDQAVNVTGTFSTDTNLYGTKYHTITVTSGSNGSISPEGTRKVIESKNETFAIEPNEGYKIKEVKVDNVAISLSSLTEDNEYIFENVTEEHTLYASFEEDAESGLTITTVPSAKEDLFYTGSPLALLNEGAMSADSVSAGYKFKYQLYNVNNSYLDDAPWTDTIPTGTNKATYKVKYKVVKSNGSDTAPKDSKGNPTTGNITIKIEDAPTAYDVTASVGSGGGGTISPAGATSVDIGADITYTISPSRMHHIKDVKVDGVSVGVVSTYTFENIQKAHTIVAEFEWDEHEITVIATGHGSVTPNGKTTVTAGTQFDVSASPELTYHIADVKIDGESIHFSAAPDFSYSFCDIDDDHTIEIIFEIDTFMITVTQSDNGTISPETGRAAYGSSKTYTITPDTGYHIKDVKVDGTSVGTNTTYSFTNIESQHSITAEFEIDTHKITASAGENGSISPLGEVTVDALTDKTFTITPAENYNILDVVVDGVSVGTVSEYTFEDILADHTISVTFAKEVFKITASCGEGGSISPETVNVEKGSDKTFTITPNENYYISDVKVDGTSVGAVESYTFTNVTVAHSIEAYFALNTHTVTFHPENGDENTVVTVTNGQTVTAIAAPSNFPKTFVGWAYENGEEYNFNASVTEDIDLYAVYRAANGIWATGIQNFEYDGTKKTQDVRVYDGEQLLKAGTDYTVTYKNNTNAYTWDESDYLEFESKLESTGKAVKVGTFDPKKAPQVIIKAKGQYADTKIVYFQITVKDIADSDVEVENIYTTYNKKKQAIIPTIKYNGKTLKNNTDFVVNEYVTEKNNKNAYKDPGTYLITIEGKKNFTGTKQINLVISADANQLTMTKTTVKGTKNIKYTGEPVVQDTVTVSYKKDTLVEGTDYTVSYVNNTEAGTATMILTGTGTDGDNDGLSYIGTKKVTFKITALPMSKAVVKNLSPVVYTGSERIPTGYSVLYGEDTLVENRDYTVSVKNTTKAGNATLTLTGKGSYSGTKSVKLAIDKADISNDNVTLTCDNTAEYTKSGAKVSPVLKYNGMTLVEGTDYTISYANNKKLFDLATSTGKKPTATIKGKGNYTGIKTVEFSVVQDNISDINIYAADKVENLKANGWYSAVTVKDKDGKALKNNTDYTAVYTLVQAGALEPVVLTNKTDKIAEGSVIKVEVTGKGNYTGTAQTTYRILKAKHDISAAKFTVKTKPYINATTPVTITEEDITKAVMGTTPLVYGVDYEIDETSYVKNTKTGTASVTLVGKGEYGGRKTVKFKISKKGVITFWVGIRTFS